MPLSEENKRPLLWLLAPSFLFGPQTWQGVAQVLRAAGHCAIVADPRPPKLADSSFVSPWAEAVVSMVPADTDASVVVVGHSASCPRLPLVASMLLDRNIKVAGIVLVNGRFPADGRAPVEEDEPLAAMLDGLIRPNGYLPPWQRWWGSLVEDMLPDQQARNRIFEEAHSVPRILFDEPIPAPELPGHVGRGYLTMGEMYRPSHDRAVAEGWFVGEVEGEHLHMVVRPDEVAEALGQLVAQFDTEKAD